MYAHVVKHMLLVSILMNLIGLLWVAAPQTIFLWFPQYCGELQSLSEWIYSSLRKREVRFILFCSPRHFLSISFLLHYQPLSLGSVDRFGANWIEYTAGSADIAGPPGLCAAKAATRWTVQQLERQQSHVLHTFFFICFLMFSVFSFSPPFLIHEPQPPLLRAQLCTNTPFFPVQSSDYKQLNVYYKHVQQPPPARTASQKEQPLLLFTSFSVQEELSLVSWETSWASSVLWRSWGSCHQRAAHKAASEMLCDRLCQLFKNFSVPAEWFFDKSHTLCFRHMLGICELKIPQLNAGTFICSCQLGWLNVYL